MDSQTTPTLVASSPLLPPRLYTTKPVDKPNRVGADDPFHLLSDNMSQLAWMADETGSVYWYNRKWYDYTGATFDEVKGFGWRKVHHPNHLLQVLEKAHYCMSTGQEFEEIVRLRRKDGQYRWFLTRGVPLRDTQGKVTGWLGTDTDITERRIVEDSLWKANVAAERVRELAEKANQAKDQFLAVLSHELRTPLTPILAAISLMDGDPGLAPEVRELADIIRRNVNLEVRLIDDLLDLTRIVNGKVLLTLGVVEMATIVEQVADTCRPEVEAKRLEFSIDIESAPLPVQGDSARLQQLLWNLVKNSIKFTPVGGIVGIRAFREGETVVIEVRDSGIGIAPHALVEIFDPFEQADPDITQKFGGLGLGLAITRKLTELHGGMVSAHSAGIGEGATFRVVLPLERAVSIDKPKIPT